MRARQEAASQAVTHILVDSSRRFPKSSGQNPRVVAQQAAGFLPERIQTTLRDRGTRYRLIIVHLGVMMFSIVYF